MVTTDNGNTSAIQKIIDAIIFAETGGDPNGGYTNDPHDAGGRTIWGISERANPDLWANGPPTREQAVGAYISRYVKPFHGLEEHLAFAQMVDWGVTSGPRFVIQTVQRLVRAESDGYIGQETLSRVSEVPEVELNNLLVVEHVKIIGRLVQRRPYDLKYLSGWLNRALLWFKL